jgi:hypothetical protein
MCTKEDTINTGINIDTVKESKLNPHSIFKDSESSHLNNCIFTGVLYIPTSTNVNIAKRVVITTHVQVIICEPVTPTFLPKKPAIMEPNRGKIKIVKYII